MAELGITYDTEVFLRECGSNDGGTFNSNDAPLSAIEELKSINQWVGWKYIHRPGTAKPTKPPVNPHNGQGASHSQPLHWGSHKQARMGAKRYDLAGVGFVLSEKDDFTGIDLDNCRDPETEELDPWAEAVVALGETYAEVSPSGRGIRLFARGKVASATKCDPAGVEIYGSHRYMTVTENHIEGTPIDIRPAPQTLEMLLSRADAMRLQSEPEAPAAAPHINTTQRQAAAGGRSDFFKNVNDLSLKLLGMWVTALFPRAKYQNSTGSYRVSSKDLGRTLQEDLSLAPNGIVDFGVADMGDGNLGKRTAIDIVMEYGGAPDAIAGAKWLCDRMNKTPESLGWSEGVQHDEEAQRIGDQIAAGNIAAARAREYITVDGARIDPETGEVLEDTATQDDPDQTETASAGQSTGPDARQIETLVASSLAGKPIPKQEWLVEDLIPHANVAMLGGDGATGKSLIALQLGVAVATGGSWIGLRPKAGRVLFVSAEDEVAELHRRLARIEPRLELLNNLIILPLAGKDAVLAAPMARDGMLKPTPLFAGLKSAIAVHKPDLLILDTLADLFGGDEIKKVQARQFIALLRGLAFDFNTTVLLLSHPSQSGMDSGSGTSGNTAWNNSVRSRLYFERRFVRDGKKVIEDDRDIRILTTKKSNRSATGEQIVVRYVKGRFEREQTSSLNARDAAHQAERVFLALLEQFTRENRNVSPNKGPTYAPALFEGHPNAAGVTSKSFARAMDRLLESGRINVEVTGSASRKRHRLVILQRDDDENAGAFAPEPDD